MRKRAVLGSGIGLGLLVSLGSCGAPEVPSMDEALFEVELSGFDGQVASQIRRQQQLLQESIAAGTPSCEDIGTLGQLYHAYDLPVAARAYDEAARCDSQEARWPYLRGRLLADLGDLNGAMQSLQQAVELAPDTLPVHLALGEVALEVDRLDLAEATFEAALAKDPRQGPAWLGLGRVHLDRQASDAARSALEEALKLSPQANAVHHHLARLARLEGDGQAARHHAALAGTRLPPLHDPWMEAVLARRTGAHNLLQSAQSALLDGHIEEARATYRAALQVDPESVDGWINLGGIEAQLGHDVVAQEAFERARALDEGEPRVHFNLGVLAARTGRWREAEASFRRTLKLDPGFDEGRLQLALALRGGGAVEDAELTLRQAAASPGGAMAHVWLARWRMEEGRYGEALQWLERGMVSDTDPRLAHALARFLATCPDGELRDGTRAATLLPQQASPRLASWELLRTDAMVEAELGRFESAAATQNQALAKAPHSAALRQTLEAELQGYREGHPLRWRSWNGQG